MALKPIRPCIEPRCPNYTPATRCKQHESEFEAKRRQDPDLTGRRSTSAEERRARGLALWRADYRCEQCGRTKADLTRLSRRTGRNLTLQVHHVDGDARNNQQGNLRVLCGGDRDTCHGAAAKPAQNPHRV